MEESCRRNEDSNRYSEESKLHSNNSREMGKIITEENGELTTEVGYNVVRISRFLVVVLNPLKENLQILLIDISKTTEALDSDISPDFNLILTELNSSNALNTVLPYLRMNRLATVLSITTLSAVIMFIYTTNSIKHRHFSHRAKTA